MTTPTHSASILSHAPIGPGGQIASVQVLRAIAALTVVFGHAQHEAVFEAARLNLTVHPNHLLPWGAGVDLFFVISGFIMVFASEKLFGARESGVTFLRRRLIRIVPLYWLLSGAYLALVMAAAAQPVKFDTSAPSLLAAFLFVPFDTYANGMPQPFYSLGWTLNYEMFFYVVFALFIGLSRTRAVAGVTLVLVVGVLATRFITLPTMLDFWGQPIVLEFVLGMGIALAHRAGWRLPRALAYALVVAGVGALMADPMGASLKLENGITPNDLTRLVFWGLPTALILGALVLMSPKETAQAPGAFMRFCVYLGDASYALYLIHPFAIVVIRKVWLAAHLEAHFGFWPMVGVIMIGAIIAACVLHESVEKPLTRWLTARGSRAPQPSLANPGNASSK